MGLSPYDGQIFCATEQKVPVICFFPGLEHRSGFLRILVDGMAFLQQFLSMVLALFVCVVSIGVFSLF